MTGEVGGEPVGRVQVAHDGHAPRHGDRGAEDVPDLIDELPVLAARAALGGSLDGQRRQSSSGSKRATGSPQLVAGFRALGVDADERPDGF